ncbi:hypothetical protein HMPREF9056_02815 [Actinomyces sp. oral taxon 170 str. F0386]|nr:hypothetical protein HMPREF9056_02815 [Actinomyces sp. oral taxon 170 str. F0386]
MVDGGRSAALPLRPSSVILCQTSTMGHRSPEKPTILAAKHHISSTKR